ncbi:MAG: Uma2 family endonuclease [Planctomycetia bacterium]|nr:Uma2 family endonuclease [Planctomycetia bacterium]
MSTITHEPVLPSQPVLPKSARTFRTQVKMPQSWTLADLQARLGGIPAERILLNPPPGCATEDDVQEMADHHDRLCELVDGTLVEKAMGHYESLVTILLAADLVAFVRKRKLGKIYGADAAMRILPHQVRMPDISFFSWKRWPKQKLPRRPIPAIVPDLAVEVISETNTRAEIRRKLREYFQAGVRLVWSIDPGTRTARAYTSASKGKEIADDGVLDGGAVLPGFRLSLKKLFAEADEQRPDDQKP